MKATGILKELRIKYGRSIFLTVLGTLILTFGVAVFTIPHRLVAGGMSGLAILLDALIGSEFLTVDGIIAILTWVFFALGWIFLGSGFAAKTLLSTIVYPIGVSLFLPLTDPTVLGGFFNLQDAKHGQISLLLAAAAGGLFVGLGCALTFLGGASTGGTDIPALILCRYFSRLKSSVALFVTDATIILGGMLIQGDLTLTLLGILHAFICAAVIDRVFLGPSRALMAQIVSKKYEEINRAVIEELGRTSTVLDAVGGYSQEQKKMISVSFTMSQYTALLRLVRRIDAEAFVTVHRVHEVSGTGWK
ncbi:MAG: YitT family protein [Clostridia bacterium]|nr:YitT family protein [Clostridia bacterium]